jgi:hypothetical protein
LASVHNTLKEDDPDALDCVLRYIYRIPPELPSIKAGTWWVPWRFWLNVYITADKYLEPKLSKKVCGFIYRGAQFSSNLEEIIDTIQALRTENRHNKTLVELADMISTYHLKPLLRNKRYRLMLDGDKNLLWSHVYELLSRGTESQSLFANAKR